MTKAAGFSRFHFLATVVFVISFAGFLTLQFQATPGDSVADASPPAAMATTDASDDAPDVSRPRTLPANTSNDSRSSPGSGIKSILARFFDDEDKSPNASAAPTQPYTEAQHADWVAELYVQLTSPDPLPAAAEDTAPVISGRVLTRHGWPVAGIEVTAEFRDYVKSAESSAIKHAVGTSRTVTNDDGFYAFRGLPPGTYLIRTRESGSYAPARLEVRAGVKYADLVLNPQRYAQVRGVVTDTMGTAIKGVRIMPLVKGIPASAVSNVDGEFALAVALQRDLRGFPVRLQASGFREQRYQVTEADWAAGGDTLVTVVMEPAYEFSTVSGSVKDTAGLPAAGEIVRMYSPSLTRSYRAVADEGGEYEFAEVEIADDYQLWVRPGGPYRDFVEANVAMTAGYVRRDIVLETLERGYRLSGRILDQRGTPVPGLTLTVHSKAATEQRLPVTSDDYGRFEVENVPEGELVFKSRSMPYYSLTGLYLNGSDTDKKIELVVNRGKHKLVGKVVGSDGRPVAAPKVFITASQMVNGMQSRSSISTSADADGRFVFTDLSAGEHTVTVNAPGFEGVRVKPVVGNQNELVVRLERNST